MRLLRVATADSLTRARQRSKILAPVGYFSGRRTKGKISMAQARCFRAFVLTAIALTLSPVLAAQVGDPEVIEQRLNAEFKPTRIASDRKEIVTTGDRVVIQKSGLTMYAVTSPMPPSYSYKNGKIGHGLTGLGKDVVISMKTPGGTAADYPHRPFAVGEQCWVTGVQVQKDGIVFQLYSDRYDDLHYYANLKIVFPDRREMPPVDSALQLVAEVLTVVPAKDRVDKTAVEPAVVSVVVPAAKSHPPGVSGKYNFDEGDSQLNFVSSSGCIMLGPGGTESAGKYRVSGEVLTMDCTVTGSSFNLKIQGDKLVADDGHTWILEAAGPPLPPGISVGQTKAEVAAAFGQPERVSRLGGKDIYYYKDMKVTFTGGKVSSVE